MNKTHEEDTEKTTPTNGVLGLARACCILPIIPVIIGSFCELEKGNFLVFFEGLLAAAALIAAFIGLRLLEVKIKHKNSDDDKSTAP